ncbi:MAG: DUF460 domain-containing protein [Candidatus Micrarchaeota archaeon]|nr:DUF460 domain-containing protein [Candidatus Micrarchaeota archaeon]MDE1834246.1 DUF460 domain-containing protein [Candidatus Micrarchaeota archaeon]MDE1859549.1 DUF460 domain-containing protein [Candidatus Micrarchaeota archaeon]
MNHIIVGVDSGKRAAIACLDLDGNPVLMANGTFVGLGWFVEKIHSTGTPVIIASDKKKPSTLPAKLSAIFGTTLFSAGYDISVKRKQELARKYGISNLHERDAMSAAVAAYNTYKNKLEQAGVFAKKHMVQDVDTLKAMVIKRYSMHEAIDAKPSVERFKRT